MLSLSHQRESHPKNKSIFTYFSEENKDHKPNKSTKVFLKKTTEKEKFQIDQASMKKV